MYALRSESARFDHVTASAPVDSTRQHLLRRTRHALSPRPSLSITLQSTLIPLSFPYSDTSRLKSRYQQYSDRPESQAQQSHAAMGRRIRPKHHEYSIAPVEPLFGTTALSDRIIVYRIFTYSLVRLLLSFLSEHPLAFPFYLSSLPYSTSRPLSRPGHDALAFFQIRTPIVSCLHHRAGLSPAWHFPLLFIILLTTIGSILVSIASPSPYTYPCARLAEKQATVAQDSPLLLVCVPGDRSPFPPSFPFRSLEHNR